MNFLLLLHINVNGFAIYEKLSPLFRMSEHYVTLCHFPENGTVSYVQHFH